MGFIIYTWNQYTRKIDSENYFELINFFGNFSWTAVVFSIMAGFIIDLFARFINNLYQIHPPEGTRRALFNCAKKSLVFIFKIFLAKYEIGFQGGH